jgi:hypothetical protein
VLKTATHQPGIALAFAWRTLSKERIGADTLLLGITAMHDEETARLLWCPWARVQVGYGGDGGGAFAAVNRTWDWIRKHLGWETGDDESEVCNCIASKCAAWRWVREEVPGVPRLTQRSQTRGFCGLAGSPSGRET